MGSTYSAEPIVLEPRVDPVTGQTVYTDPSEVAVRPAATPVDTPPAPVDTAPAPGATPAPAGADFLLTGEGKIVGITPGDPDAEPDVVSVLPEGRMAAASWDQIAQTLRKVEEGKSGDADVQLRPGGTLVITGHDNPPQPVSRLPQGRMAAVNPGPSQGDVEVLRRLDPGNVEGWTPVLTDLVAGWTFRLTPPIPGQSQFVFFAFRSPSDRNAYRTAVLEPDMDRAYGHTPHMIHANVGGQRIPVICGPAGEPASDLAAVRTHAAKWMAYTSARLAGRDPGFSL